MSMEGLTVSEMAQILLLPEGTVRTRLSRMRIKPITNSPVYDKSVVDAIRNVKPKGWPRKKPTEPKASE